MTLAEASILIVDDEPILRMTFCVLLQQQGATVFSAEHGEEALEVLRREAVDVMLTDKHMPVMDGPSLLRAANREGLRVPTVFFVNAVDWEDMNTLQDLGVVETVSKPLHPEQLTSVLTKVLARRPKA